MKLNVNKKNFIQSWSVAERSAAGGNTMGVLSSVLVKADEKGITLQATDVRTSICCEAAGVVIEEPGTAVFPVKMVSELFKKAPGEEFSITVTDGKAVLKAGKSRYNFSTFPVKEFPELPSHEQAKTFCKILAKDLAKVLEEGTIAASTTEDFPLYLSSANLSMKEGVLSIVSTDTRRLALSSTVVPEKGEDGNYLLPMKGIKEIQRILSFFDPEEEVSILYDAAQFFFVAKGIEFAVRRVDSHFPAYERILPKTRTTNIIVDRSSLISALERIDIVVRDHNRMVILDISEGESFKMRGKAPDFGQAKEEISARVTGEELKFGVNTKFFMEALKVLRDQEVSLSFNGSQGHLTIKRVGEESFICLVAPINVPAEEEEEKEE